MTEAGPGYRGFHLSLDEQVREAETRAAQVFAEKRKQDVVGTLLLVCKMIENLDPAKPNIIDLSSLKGVSQQTIMDALKSSTRFTFAQVDGPFLFSVQLKK